MKQPVEVIKLIWKYSKRLVKFWSSNCFNLTFPLSRFLHIASLFRAKIAPNPSGTEMQVKRMLGAKSKGDTFMTMTSSVSILARSRNLSVALAVVGLVICGEYFFRHYVLFWLPTFGALLVNDMLSLFLVYLLLTVGLGSFMHNNWRQELAGVGQSLREGQIGRASCRERV